MQDMPMLGLALANRTSAVQECDATKPHRAMQFGSKKSNKKTIYMCPDFKNEIVLP
jgi:hypothetical protein